MSTSDIISEGPQGDAVNHSGDAPTVTMDTLAAGIAKLMAHFDNLRLVVTNQQRKLMRF